MLEKLIVHKLPDYDYIEIYPITDFHDGDPKTDETMLRMVGLRWLRRKGDDASRT